MVGTDFLSKGVDRLLGLCSEATLETHKEDSLLEESSVVFHFKSLSPRLITIH